MKSIYPISIVSYDLSIILDIRPSKFIFLDLLELISFKGFNNFYYITIFKDNFIIYSFIFLFNKKSNTLSYF